MGTSTRGSEPELLTAAERVRTETALLIAALSRKKPFTVAEAFRGRPQGERLAAEAVAADLVGRGLLRSHPPSSRRGRARYELTDEGRRIGQERLAEEKPGRKAQARARKGAAAALEQRVEVLEGRLAQWITRLEALERRLGALERAYEVNRDASRSESPSVPAHAEPPVPDVNRFKDWLFTALDELDRRNRRLGLVPIPQVRQALAGRVGRRDFDRLVLQLAAQREIVLVAHDRPAVLSPADRDGSLQDPLSGQLYHWIRWGM